MNESQEHLTHLLIARCDATEVFEFVKEALDFLASLVLRRIIENSRLTLLPGRNDRSQLLSLEVLANLITVISCVHDPIGSLGHHRAVVKDRLNDRGILACTTGERKREAGLVV
jgi:hypothetical protein